jgi:ubiquinone/menaquinone biosynthesis C-methylase UbiE
MLVAALAVAAAACTYSGSYPTRQSGTGTGLAASAPKNRDPHGPANVSAYIAQLENAKRESYLPTKRVVELLGLKGSERVADLGCGPGVVSVELATAVPTGIVLAIDVEPAQLDRVNAKITKDGIRNVVPVLCTTDDARIPPAFADIIVIVDTYHHFDERVAYLRRLGASLAPGGKIVNIDFKDGDLPEGPPASHKVVKATMLAEFAEAGFRVAREEKEFQYHDYTVFEKAP